MDHKMKQASGRDKQQQQEQQVRRADHVVAEDEENEEIEESLPQQNKFIDRVTQVMAKIAGSRFGQTVFKKTDRVLKVLEETAKWSLPPEENEIELQRPLPWILFLSLIVWLRVFRFSFSVVAHIVGLQPVTPKSMVYYLQSQRRKLRVIRIRGLKTLKDKETENIANENSKREGNSLMGNLRKLLDSTICKPGQRREAPAIRLVFKQDGIDNTDDMVKRSSKRPRQEEPDLSDLTVSEMLDKFASEDSDNDSDYVPPENEDADDDESTTSHNTTASGEEADKYHEETHLHTNDEPNENPKMEEVKENGATKNHSKIKPAGEIQNENHSPVISTAATDQMYATSKDLNNHDPVENGESKLMPWPTSEAALLTSQTTRSPNSSFNSLAAAQHDDESEELPTPVQEIAASLKSPSSLAVEAGSLQDFHATFHPAPTEKGSSGEAKTSMAHEEAVSDDGASSCSPENQAPNQRKNFYHSSHNKHHTHHYYNAKNRNKNRH